MDKQVERLSKQLHDFSEIINGFKSEAVQIKIIEKILPHLANWTKKPAISKPSELTDFNQHLIGSSEPTERKPGAKRILDQLLETDYFDTLKSIGDISAYCIAHFNDSLQSSQLSGVLLTLVKDGKLVRENNESNNRYVYLKPRLGN